MVFIHFCVYLLCGMGSLCGGWGMVLNQLWYNSDLTYIGRHHVYKTAGLVDTGIRASLCNWTKLFSGLERLCDAACATIVSAPAALSDASPRINPRCVSCPRSPSEALLLFRWICYERWEKREERNGHRVTMHGLLFAWRHRCCWSIKEKSTVEYQAYFCMFAVSERYFFNTF